MSAVSVRCPRTATFPRYRCGAFGKQQRPFSQPSLSAVCRSAGVFEDLRTELPIEKKRNGRLHEQFLWISHARIPRTKEPNDYHVLCFGGSTTWGVAESNEKTWPGVLETKLQTRYPNRRIRVFNLAIDSGSSPMSLVNYCLVGTHLQPDLVIVYHGVNDLWIGMGAIDHKTDYTHALQDVDPASMNPKWRGLQAHLPNWAFHSAVVSVITKSIDDSLGTNDLAAVLQKDYPRDPVNPFRGMEIFFQNLKTMAAIAEGHETHILFSTFHWIDNETPLTFEFNRRLKEFFSDNSFRYVDQAKLIPDQDLSIHIDVVHFTQLGREMMAENYFKYIVEEGLVDAAKDQE
ncbi:MAG: SGNH/GDSL hydrolase family protein [Planctomycetes bacterium]|nr:SGNH/GDSL hydrolase family protein [Planctomycetota bacterium]